MNGTTGDRRDPQQRSRFRRAGALAAVAAGIALLAAACGNPAGCLGHVPVCRWLLACRRAP